MRSSGAMAAITFLPVANATASMPAMSRGSKRHHEPSLVSFGQTERNGHVFFGQFPVQQRNRARPDGIEVRPERAGEAGLLGQRRRQRIEIDESQLDEVRT